jgi:hypothetical protein
MVDTEEKDVVNASADGNEQMKRNNNKSDVDRISVTKIPSNSSFRIVSLWFTNHEREHKTFRENQNHCFFTSLIERRSND